MPIDSTIGANGGGRARANPFALARRAISTWSGRARGRRALASLDARTLKDLGLSHYDVRAEASKWWWRA